MTDDRPLDKLEAELVDVLNRLERAGLARQSNPSDREAERTWLALLDSLPPLQRAIALAQGEEAAVPIEWEVPWSTGAPLPHVLADGARTLRFGRGSDDLRGHGLEDAGLQFYGAHTVANSRWLASARETMLLSTHDDADLGNHKHVLLMFHDESFECLVTGHTVEVIRASFAGTLEIARQRLSAPMSP